MLRGVFSAAAGACILSAMTTAVVPCQADEKPLEPEVLDVEPVWSGHKVSFCLLTEGEHQFAAYYDANRQMTVAQRTLDSRTWTFTKLPSHVVWDSHNYVTMTLDHDGFLHVSGNMHCVPLIYFRAEKPYDASSLVQVPNMVDPALEKKVTYPTFISGPDNLLIFRYRDGQSGKGNDIYNVYDHASRTWKHLLDRPVTDGQGKMNAYFSAPALGPDGRFHMYGVWRDTYRCETNHDLSYARSKDLRHWEKANGDPLETPLTVSNIDIVDPVPPKGGLLNGNCKLGFDSQQRPVITYHKYDSDGHSQVFSARFESGAWRIYPTTDWPDCRWDFEGGGSINSFGVHPGAIKRADDGTLTLSIRSKAGSGTWLIDETSLKITSKAPGKPGPRAVESYRKMESTFPEMAKRRCSSMGHGPDPKVRYALAWETLPQNRDRPREGPLPDPSMLRLYTLIQP